MLSAEIRLTVASWYFRSRLPIRITLKQRKRSPSWNVVGIGTVFPPESQGVPAGPDRNIDPIVHSGRGAPDVMGVSDSPTITVKTVMSIQSYSFLCSLSGAEHPASWCRRGPEVAGLRLGHLVHRLMC